jgi:hypothetical protein
MKKILFLALLILAACSTSQDPEPIKTGPTPIESNNPAGDPPRSPDNAIDPGCHGGEWYETHNLSSISPWQYNEWATFTIKTQVPQLGLGGMGPVQIKYKIKNVSGTTRVRLNFLPITTSGIVWTGNFTPVLNPGQSAILTGTIAVCQPATHLTGGWYEYQFGMMFQPQSGGVQASIGGEILSITGIDCWFGNTHCAEHKKATHDQGFVWTVYP